MSQNSTTIAAIYNLDTDSYKCETNPNTYQTYTCSYIKSSVIKVVTTAKNTFEKLARNAGIEADDL